VPTLRDPDPLTQESERRVLYKRIFGEGTLTEPKGVPNPGFALSATINWMRALTVLVGDLDFPAALAFYASEKKQNSSRLAENTVIEQLILALHQLAAVEAMRTAERRADVARAGVICWYYGVSCAASAMIAAQDGTIQGTHAATAERWVDQFPARDRAPSPFHLRVSTLVEAKANNEVQLLRAGNNFTLQWEPGTRADALGACCAYLPGSVDCYRWKSCEKLRKTPEFKALGVSDFRSKPARELRDQRLAGRSVAFLHQAFRYRGKANYREALFLGYGRATETLLVRYIDDLAIVLTAFLRMAGAFVSMKLGPKLWRELIDDLEKERAFSLSPRAVWT